VTALDQLANELLCDYDDRGWALVAVRAGGKRPTTKGWPDQEFSIYDIAAAGNVGLKLGRRSGGTVDTDLDCPEALVLADLYLPETGAIFGRSSKPRSHRLYIAIDAVFEAFVDPIAGETLLELRADGATGGCHQTIVPPSIADGERREWHGGTIEPATIDHRVLRRRCARLAIGCLMHRYVGETAARQPLAPGWDHPRLLWECDHELGRQAYEWLDRPAPDTPRHHPKPAAERSLIEVELHELARAIPNDFGWEGWNTAGMAFFASSGGSEEGLIAFDVFSAKHPSYDPHETRARWENYRRSPPTRIGKGSLIRLARQAGWRPGGRRDRAA
jgi:hypothetical protein